MRSTHSKTGLQIKYFTMLLINWLKYGAEVWSSNFKYSKIVLKKIWLHWHEWMKIVVALSKILGGLWSSGQVSLYASFHSQGKLFGLHIFKSKTVKSKQNKIGLFNSN